ncbi:MAG: aminoglycoside phosphotransferase family protein [Chloroflexota bacterium]|nr:aminoglycoside phosphotransferase family protein [Chloroflexota bacterium]
MSALLALLFVVADFGSPLRPLVALWFLGFCPGMAVVQLLAIRNRLGEIMLAIALSVTMATLTALAMIYANVWSPQLGVGLLAAMTLAAAGLPLVVGLPSDESTTHSTRRGTQTDNGESRMKLRLLLGAQSVLGALGLTSTARRFLGWLTGRGQRKRAIRTILPGVRAAIPNQPDLPAPAGWTSVQLVPTIADRMVLTVGPPRQQPVAIVKLAPKGDAGSNLERETATIRALRAETCLGDWRSVLPLVLATGEEDGMVYRAERLLPGTPATRFLSAGGDRQRLQDSMAKAIRVLHHETATTVLIDAERLRPWVDDPIDALLELSASRPGWSNYRPSIGRLRSELRKALLDRSLALSWIHGDYWPGNVLIADDAQTVTGIIDWDLAEAAGLPLLDVMHLILSMRMIERQQEMGIVVSTLLREPIWTREERALLSSAWRTLPGSHIGRRQVLLLAWLRHVDHTRTKAQRFGGPTLWESQNVERVLQVL